MGIRADLLTYLAASAPLTALVAGRVYWTRRPQGSALPCLVCNRITGGYGHTLDGGAGWAQPTIQIDCIATSNAGAEAVAGALRDEMQGFAGTWTSTRVTSVILRNELDLYDADKVAGDIGTHRIALDYEIQHEETIPSP